MEPLEYVDHGVHRFRGSGNVLHFLDVQLFQVSKKKGDETVGEFPEGEFFLPRSRDGLVVHVGDVHGMVHAEAAELQVPAEEVVEEEGPEVADVRVAVHRGPAGVDGDRRVVGRILHFFSARDELLHRAGQGVVNSQRQVLLLDLWDYDFTQSPGGELSNIF